MNKLKEFVNTKTKTTVGIIGVMLVAILAITIGTSLADTESNYLKNQKIDGISFEDANVVYKDGVSTITVNIYNTNKDKYNIKTITMNFKDNEGKTITLVSYVGDPLEADEGRQITASIDKNITESVNLEYVINKD